MATDVFGRTVTWGGAFSADGASVSFAGFGDTGLLIQQITYNYQQNITRLYEVAGAKVYLVAGRTQGTCQVARVIGPALIGSSFYSTYGDVCDAASNSIVLTLNTGCGTQSLQTQTVTMNNVVITAVNGSVRAEDMVITEQMTLMFLYLTVA